MTNRFLIPLGFTLAACGGETSESQPPPPADVQVVRPSAIESLDLGLETHPLPAGLGRVHVATFQGESLLGGETGLFHLTTTGAVLVDDTPVTGLVAVEDVGVVVGHTSGIGIWNGSLVTSPLQDTLGGMSVTSLSPRGDQLWIGTDGALYFLEDGELYAFESVTQTTRLVAFQGGAVLADQIVIREDADGFSIQDLSDEIAASAIVPANGDRIFAVAAGGLAERTVQEGRATWQPVALTTDATDEGATGVRALDVDSSGAVWLLTGTELARIDGTVVAHMQLPIAADQLAMSSDGAAWLSDGTSIVRVGEDAAPLSYAADIAPFSENNCNRCHNALGVGHPLDTFDVWQNEVDLITAALDDGRMPQDGEPLVGGTVELIRRWKADGLLP